MGSAVTLIDNRHKKGNAKCKKVEHFVAFGCTVNAMQCQRLNMITAMIMLCNEYYLLEEKVRKKRLANLVLRLRITVYISPTALRCTEEREGQQCQSWVFTFWDFSAAPLSRAAISTKIKDPNGAGPGGDERCRDGTLLWISNAVHVSKVMTDSQALSQASLLRTQAIKVSYSLSWSSEA